MEQYYEAQVEDTIRSKFGKKWKKIMVEGLDFVTKREYNIKLGFNWDEADEAQSGRGVYVGTCVGID